MIRVAVLLLAFFLMSSHADAVLVRCGDIEEDATVEFTFRTGATLSGSPVVSVFGGNNTSPITTGVTLTPDFDGVTGLNHVAVDTSASASYSTGRDYNAVVTTGTVGGVSVAGVPVGHFAIENRSGEWLVADDATIDVCFYTGSATGGVTLGGTPEVSVYPDGSTTELIAGVTLTPDFASVTGLNHVRVDTSASASYVVDRHYSSVITVGTVGGTSVVGERVDWFAMGATASGGTGSGLTSEESTWLQEAWAAVTAGTITSTSPTISATQVTVIRGDDYGDTDGWPALSWTVPLATMDLTNASTITMTVRDRYSDAVIFTVTGGTVTNGGSDPQTVELAIDGDTTAGKPLSERYKYDLQVIFTSGVEATIKAGSSQIFRLVDEQTR